MNDYMELIAELRSISPRIKEWTLRDPGNSIHKISNLREWCEENAWRLDATPKTALVNLSCLRPGVKNFLVIWHGWTWGGELTKEQQKIIEKLRSIFFHEKGLILRDPDGKIHEIHNLQKWCRMNAEWFGVAPATMRHFLSRLNPKFQNVLLSWHGWTWAGKIDEQKKHAVESCLERVNGKEWIFKAPDGIIHRFHNLQKWCIENAEAVDATPKTAYAGLLRLRPGSLNPRASWHGWKWAGEIPPDLNEQSKGGIIGKDWIFRDPDGRIHKIHNLMKWCRENAGIFGQSVRYVYIQLSRLQPNSPNPLMQWHGWTWGEEIPLKQQKPYKWILRDPNGEIFRSNNLREWCNENAWRFNNAPLSTYNCLVRLHPRAKNRLDSWHGWTWAGSVVKSE